MNNRQEVKVRTGALTKGTRHQRDKCADLENQALPAGASSIGRASGGPRGGVRWKSVGAFLCRAKAKRRKAVRVGQAGRQQRKPNFRWNVGGIGDGTGTKSVGSYPWRSAGFRASAVGGRTKERTNRWPCRSRTGAQYPKSNRKVALTPRATSAGRESAGGEGGGSNLEGLVQQDSKLPREVALDADRDLSRPTERCDVIASRLPRDQSPQHLHLTLTYFAMRQRRSASCNAARIDGTDGSRTGRRWG